MAANAFDMNTRVVTRGNVIRNMATGATETVASVDRARRTVSCESGRKVGFDVLRKGWAKL